MTGRNLGGVMGTKHQHHSLMVTVVSADRADKLAETPGEDSEIFFINFKVAVNRRIKRGTYIFVVGNL